MPVSKALRAVCLDDVWMCVEDRRGKSPDMRRLQRGLLE